MQIYLNPTSYKFQSMPRVFSRTFLTLALSHRYERLESIPSFAFFYRNCSSPINISRKKKLRKSSVLFLPDTSTCFPKLHSLLRCLCLGFIACKHSRAVFSPLFLPSHLSLLLQQRLRKKRTNSISLFLPMLFL